MMQGLSVYLLRANEARSNNQLKKTLFSNFISIYLATLKTLNCWKQSNNYFYKT
jgi:hypothetical protein